MLTTAGMTRRSIGASVGKPRVSAAATGGVAAIGVESGGPGSGGAGKRAIHHPPKAATATSAAMSTVFRIVENPPFAAKLRTGSTCEPHPSVTFKRCRSPSSLPEVKLLLSAGLRAGPKDAGHFEKMTQRHNGKFSRIIF
jgi:hypothetical protein